jgi:Protein-glutamine gamma-glutamyltransferase
MGHALTIPSVPRAGIYVQGRTANEALREVVGRLAFLGFDGDLEVKVARDSGELNARLSARLADWLTPQGNTLDLAKKLGLDSEHSVRDLAAETLLAMLCSPAPFCFATPGELGAALRIRANTVAAACKTLLDFKTHEAERPSEFWAYDEERGFLLAPDRQLIEALERATQPSDSGRRYSFSCWRATEYVVLLAIARELRATHPELLAALTRQARVRALHGADFDRAYLKCHGSTQAPVAAEYFVPGDRVWFRNPDRESSAIVGYEGSYTFYLGGGRFADFWQPNHTDVLTTKCLTMFYWRAAVCRDQSGVARIDEARVTELVGRALTSPPETARILRIMLEIQEPPERFGGGCLDPTRDHARQVCRGSAELTLPDVGHRTLRSRTSHRVADRR